MTGKTILITGSSKGLGKSLAGVFAANGFNIILHGRDRQALAAAEKEVVSHKVRCDIVRGDITSPRTIANLSKVAAAMDLDILVNNAGIYVNEPLQDLDADTIRKVMETNFMAPVILSKAVYPIFRKKKSGMIVNINSLAGKSGAAGESAYSASKHALRGFTKSLQFEANKDNIRVTEIYLGAMNTEMTSGRKEPEKFIHPDEAAKMIFSICTDYQSMRITEIDLLRRVY